MQSPKPRGARSFYFLTLYSKELGYNEQIAFYLDTKAYDGFTFKYLISKAEEAKQDFMRYITELEREKELYPDAINIERKIKTLQMECAELSGTAKKFLPRSYCKDCYYS